MIDIGHLEKAALILVCIKILIDKKSTEADKNAARSLAEKVCHS